MDLATILGMIIGIGGIIAGQQLEGGHIGSILQLTAAIIVFSGTAGAVMVGTTQEDLKTGLSLLKHGFFNSKSANVDQLVKEIIDAAQTARKESILALEKKLSNFSNPYMQTVFRFVIDGVEPNTIKEVFETEIYLEVEHKTAGAKIFVDAGSFCPTIGIIGAVLGLIHVMENLSDTSKLGGGIAVAFVATVYGVGAANLFFLPLGNKIKKKIKDDAMIKEMVLTGALGIVNGMNPFIIEEKLRAYLHGSHKPEAGEA